MLTKFEAIAAACEDASTDEVLDVELELVLVELLLVVELEVGSMSPRASAPMIVTVWTTGACACGMTKFGAMLTAGCLSSAQLQAAAVPGTSCEGRLL